MKREGEMNYCMCRCDSPLGEITLESDGENLTGLWFETQRKFPNGIADADGVEVIDRAKMWIEKYFAGMKPVIDFPLSMQGTEFQKAVWREIAEIPYGSTITYGEIARQIGNASAVRAVGGAVGANPISLIVPCHRVMGAGGRITGYTGGLEIKRWLLRHEGVRVSS